MPKAVCGLRWATRVRCAVVLRCAGSEACMAGFTRSELLDVLWALARVQYLPDEAWLQAYRAALRRQQRPEPTGPSSSGGVEQATLAWACQQLGGLKL